MSDLISRQAAIDATWKEPTYTDPINVLTEVRDRIKSLPSAEPERSTEVEDILQCLDDELHPIVSPDDWWIYSKLHDMVSTLKPAQPERKKGHWVQKAYFRKSAMLDDCVMKCVMKECPYCHTEWSYDAETGVSDLNFCPNCGAEMDIGGNYDTD